MSWGYTDHRRCSWERPYGTRLCVYLCDLLELAITFVDAVFINI